MTKGVIIRRSARDDAAPDLSGILRSLGERALTSWWSCSELNYVSTDDRDVAVLDAASDLGGSVKGAELVGGLDRLLQVIDGVFTGRDEGGRLWVTVRAIDSSWWEVQSDDQRAIDAINRRYHDTEPLSRSAG